MEDIIEELTKLFIKQDLKDKRVGKEDLVVVSKKNLYKMQIKFVKYIKDYLQSK